MKGVDTVAGIGPDRGHYIPLKQRYVPLLTAMLAGVPAVTQYGYVYVTETCWQKGKADMIDNAKIMPRHNVWKNPQPLADEPNQVLSLAMGVCEKVV